MNPVGKELPLTLLLESTSDGSATDWPHNFETIETFVAPCIFDCFTTCTCLFIRFIRPTTHPLLSVYMSSMLFELTREKTAKETMFFTRLGKWSDKREAEMFMLRGRKLLLPH